MGIDVIQLSLNLCRKKMASLGKERQDLLSTIDALKEGKMLIVNLFRLKGFYLYLV